MVVQKVKRCISVLFGKEGDGQTGLYQRQAKQFALAGAVVDQEDGVMRHHYMERYQQGLCLVMTGFMCFLKILQKQ